MDKQYIILNDNKQPIHKFKNGGLAWNDVKDFDNLALIVPDPFVVLDFDTKEDAEIMLSIVEKLDLHCKVMKTDRGYHFWFKSKEQLKNYVKNRLAIGIYCDRKVCNRNAYVKIKGGGVLRPWVRDYDDNDVCYLPKWLTPVKATTPQFSFIGMGEGSGRNQALFNYVLYLQEKGFAKDDIIQTLEVINKFVFAKPLPNRELETICRPEAFKSEEELEEKQQTTASDKFKFQHEVFANILRDDYNFITYNGMLYVYKDGYYKPNRIEAEAILIDLYPSIKKQQRTEVIEYLKVIADKTEEIERNKNVYTVNLENGRYNLLTGEFTEHDSKYYDFQRIPVKYNLNAKSEVLDDVLNTVFCNDIEVLNLFEEMVADCLLKDNIYQTAFIYYGGGSNGKSTIFELLRAFLGKENVSAVELDKLGQRFQATELFGKCANIGDDLNFTGIKNNGTVKKLISGDAVQVERKGKDPFSFVSYATQIFACNEIPHTSDKSNGMLRRLCFVPCLAKFGKDGVKKDPKIKYKIITEEALSHLLNRAINGFKRLTNNGCFTEPEVVKKAKRTYTIENSSVLTWIDEAEITEDLVLSKPAGDLYIMFTDWCKISNVREIVGKKGFNKEIQREFDLAEKLQQRRLNGVRYRFFIKDI